jgi:DNA-binding CsgD family transcriptional regulator
VEEAMRESIDELNPDAAAEPKTVLFTSDGPVMVVNADFDGDGKLDLAVLDASKHRMRLWRGDGRGGFCSESFATHERWRPDRWSAERLTGRETEVATLLACGYTDREIATMLGIGRRTAETHASNVRAKLGLKSRRALLHGALWSAS